MSDVNQNLLITVNDGVATINIRRFLNICCSLIYDAFKANPIELKVKVNNKLIDEEIIINRIEDPDEFHQTLTSKTPDQIEKFFVIFALGDSSTRESRRNIRNQIAAKVFEEISKISWQSTSTDVHTIHGDLEEFSSLICFSLAEFPSQIPHKYRNLKATFEKVWKQPSLPPAIPRNNSNSSADTVISVVHSFVSDESDESCEQQRHEVDAAAERLNAEDCLVTQSTAVGTEEVKKTEKGKTLGRMKCPIIFVVLILTAIISVAAIHRNSSDPPTLPSSESPDVPQNLNTSSTLPSVSTPNTSSPLPKIRTVPTAKTKNNRRTSTTTRTGTPSLFRTAVAAPPLPNYVARFSPPQGTILSPTESDLSDTKFFSKELCSSSDFPRTLNISFRSSSSSSQVSSKISFFDVPCSSNVTGLEISGSISLRNLHSLLSKNFSHVRYLSFSGDEICDSLDESFDRLSSSTAKSKPKPPEILLESLLFLRLTNLPECKGLYRFLNEFTRIPNVETLVVDGVFISSQNSEDIQKLFQKIKSVKNLDFQPSNICPDCLVFSRSDETLDPWKSLEVLRFHVPSEVGFQGVRNLKRLFQPSLPILEFFESSVEIPSLGILKTFKRLVNLRVMNATFNLPSNQTQFSGSFFSHFPVLRESFVTLKFNATSECRRNRSVSVALTNLKKNVGTSKLERVVMTSNCEIKPVKGWSIPCFDFEIDSDIDSDLEMVFLTKCPNCSKSGCLR